jgi:FKBP-type peptidyl-prolyl cis-trans isomerase
MNSLNKTEIKGIVGSIVIMVVALSVVRFYPHVFLDKNNNDTKKENVSDLEQTLRDAHTLDGELVKLVIKDVRLGTKSEPVKNGDTLEVHYVGITQEGVKFDSSYDRGQTFSFTIGNGVVIKGWEEGLIGMKVGGKRILVIPSDMAYGNRQVGAIAPNTPLLFAVELLNIF